MFFLHARLHLSLTSSRDIYGPSSADQTLLCCFFSTRVLIDEESQAKVIPRRSSSRRHQKKNREREIAQPGNTKPLLDIFPSSSFLNRSLEREEKWGPAGLMFTPREETLFSDCYAKGRRRENRLVNHFHVTVPLNRPHILLFLVGLQHVHHVFGGG